jgi:hypothetical protein
VQGASGSESRGALAIRSLNLTHLGQVETHEHTSLTSHSLERGPWGQAPLKKNKGPECLGADQERCRWIGDRS